MSGSDKKPDRDFVTSTHSSQPTEGTVAGRCSQPKAGGLVKPAAGEETHKVKLPQTK